MANTCEDGKELVKRDNVNRIGERMPFEIQDHDSNTTLKDPQWKKRNFDDLVCDNFKPMNKQHGGAE